MDRLGQFLTPTPKPRESGVVRPILYVPAEQATVGCGPSARRADLRFVVNDMNGSAVRFADFKDRVVLLNFWATWCGPCKAEIPWLVDLQTKYGAKLQVLGFSVDDPPELLKPYAAQYRINYPLLQGLGHQDVQDAYGPIWGVPMTFLISRDGRVCRTFRGITSKDEIDTAVRSLM
jgi:thiol-disulfide isomerase/thioredoxin